MKQAVIALCVVLLSASSAYSITMEEAVEYALKNNPELRELRFEADAGRGQLEKAKLLLIANPEIEGYVSKKDKSREEGEGRYTNYGIKLSQEFEIAGQRGLRIAAAEKNLSKIAFEIKSKEQAFTADVKNAFARALAAKRKEELTKEVLARQEELLGFTKIKHQAGDVSGLEVNLAEVTLGKARRDLILAERESREAFLALQGLLGMPPDPVFNVEGELTPSLSSLPDKEGLKRCAALQRADKKAASSEEERARAALALVQKEAVPNITLSGFYDKDERRDVAGVAVSVPLPFFDRKQAERKEAQARAEQAGIRRARLETAIERNLEEAYSVLVASLNELSLFQREIADKSVENLNLLNLAFKEGKISFYDLRLAQRDTIDIQFSYLDTLLRARLALHALEQAIGGNLNEK